MFLEKGISIHAEEKGALAIPVDTSPTPGTKNIFKVNITTINLFHLFFFISIKVGEQASTGTLMELKNWLTIEIR